MSYIKPGVHVVEVDTSTNASGIENIDVNLIRLMGSKLSNGMSNTKLIQSLLRVMLIPIVEGNQKHTL